MIKIEDIEILASILNRWPLLPGERMWAQGFIERLQAAVAPPQQPVGAAIVSSVERAGDGPGRY